MWSNVVISHTPALRRLCALQGVRGAISNVCMEEVVCHLTAAVMDVVIARTVLMS